MTLTKPRYDPDIKLTWPWNGPNMTLTWPWLDPDMIQTLPWHDQHDYDMTLKETAKHLPLWYDLFGKRTTIQQYNKTTNTGLWEDSSSLHYSSSKKSTMKTIIGSRPSTTHIYKASLCLFYLSKWCRLYIFYHFPLTLNKNQCMCG